MVKVKQSTYEPVGDEVNGAVAIVQAAATLDAAVFLAVESKNVDKLLDIAALWMGLAERLGVEVEEDDEEPSDRKPFGFTKVNGSEEIDKREVIVEDA